MSQDVETADALAMLHELLFFFGGNIDDLLISFALSAKSRRWSDEKILRVLERAKADEDDHEHVLTTLARALELDGLN